jgi:uncharacterized protein (UPF0276 family)
MHHLLLPLSTLYSAHEDFCRENILPLAGALEMRRLDAGAVPPGLPLSFHSDLGAALDRFVEETLRTSLLDTLERLGVGTFSFDLGPACKTSIAAFPLERHLERESLLDLLAERVAAVRSRFSGRILLENLPYYRTGLFEHVCEPEFIAEALEAADAFLLLDLAHAACSADNLGIPRADYLRRLPLGRVRQIHVSGIYAGEMLTVDAHLCPTPEELDQALVLLGDLPGAGIGVAVEYYRDPQLLLAAYRHLASGLGLEAPQ